MIHTCSYRQVIALTISCTFLSIDPIGPLNKKPNAVVSIKLRPLRVMMLDVIK